MATPDSYPKQWLVVEAGRSLVRKSWHDMTMISRQAWKNWATVAGIGWFLVLFLMLFMAWGMQQLVASGIVTQAHEIRWLEWLNGHSPVVFSDAVWMSAPGNPIILIPILIAAAVITARMGYPLRAITILVSYFFVAVIVFAGWQTWDRPRPEVVLNGIAAPNFNSFPSGHMAESTVVYCLLCYLWLRKTPHYSERLFGIVLLAVWLGVVAIARLETGTHWITDVAGGTVIGLAWFWVLVIALRRAETVVRS